MGLKKAQERRPPKTIGTVALAKRTNIKEARVDFRETRIQEIHHEKGATTIAITDSIRTKRGPRARNSDTEIDPDRALQDTVSADIDIGLVPRSAATKKLRSTAARHISLEAADPKRRAVLARTAT